MSFVTDLKERREAVQLADLEFYRVKREKLCRERAKNGCSSDKELHRDAINRASAAASRAKLVYLARELENRTDKLEYERNLSDERSIRMAKKMRDLQDDRKKVHNVLRTLWERKDPTICAVLLESKIMQILRAVEDETCDAADSSSITPIRVSIPHMNVNGTRRSPAVDLSGLPPSSPPGSTTTEMVKLPGSQFLNMPSLRDSLCDIHPRARTVSSNYDVQPVPSENLSSTQFKSRKKRTRRSQKEIRASLAEKYRQTGVHLTRQWYDAVRDVVRTESNASSAYM